MNVGKTGGAIGGFHARWCVHLVTLGVEKSNRFKEFKACCCCFDCGFYGGSFFKGSIAVNGELGCEGGDKIGDGVGVHLSLNGLNELAEAGAFLPGWVVERNKFGNGDVVGIATDGEGGEVGGGGGSAVVAALGGEGGSFCVRRGHC